MASAEGAKPGAFSLVEMSPVACSCTSYHCHHAEACWLAPSAASAGASGLSLIVHAASTAGGCSSAAAAADCAGRMH